MSGKEKDCKTMSGDVPRRKVLRVAVCALCSEIGFAHADDMAIETLVEMLQSYIAEVGRSGQAFTELSGRTEPMCSDVAMALIEMGLDVQKLSAYAERTNKMCIMPPSFGSGPSQPRILRVGDKHSHPAHIPEHLPPFPDPHTYIQTLTNKKPVTEYQRIREKAASQKRDVERALTRFIAKTGDTEKLFDDDPYAFPLIACKPSERPYLEALLPKDEDLEALEEEEKLNERKQAQKQAQAAKEQQEKERAAAAEQDKAGKEEDDKDKNTSKDESFNQGQAESEGGDSAIDNPYLRPIKMPRLKGAKSSKSKW